MTRQAEPKFAATRKPGVIVAICMAVAAVITTIGYHSHWIGAGAPSGKSFLSASAENPADETCDSGNGDSGNGNPPGPSAPTGRPYDAEVRGIVADCARIAVNSASASLAKGKKPDPAKVADATSKCLEEKLTQNPKYKAWGDVIGATRTVITCVGDAAGIKDALKDGVSGSKTAGKAYLGFVLAALTALGSDDCYKLGEELQLYKGDNYYVAFVHHGAACVVAGVGTVSSMVKTVDEISSMTRSQVIDEVKSMIAKGAGTTLDKIGKLPELEKGIDEWLEKCKKAKKAAAVSQSGSEAAAVRRRRHATDQPPDQHLDGSPRPESHRHRRCHQRER